MAALRSTVRPVTMLRRTLFISLMLFLSAAMTYFNKGQRIGQVDNGSGGAKSASHPSKLKGLLLRKTLSDETEYALADVTSEEGIFANSSGNPNDTEIECTPPTIHEFPSDLFTNEQRAKGAVILHIFCVIYMFVALAIVCDDYFVPSLEKICLHMGFSEDVAGATFMAAGSSAPELFTSIIGVFIAKGDVGLGTIVGSAVFNILVIIGLCGLFAGQVVPLTWWPLFRDSIIYSLAITALVLVIHDGRVTCWESALMLVMYGGYILIMKFNPQIAGFWNKMQDRRRQKQIERRKNKKLKLGEGQGSNSVMIPLQSVNNTPAASSPEDEKVQVFMVDEYLSNSPKRLTFSDASLRIMLSRHFTARTRMRTACWMIIAEKNLGQEDPKHLDFIRPHDTRENGEVFHQESDGEDKDEEKGTSDRVSVNDDNDDEEGLCKPPASFFGVFKWLFLWPTSVLLFFSIPDCRKPRWERWYMATFFGSIVWIAVFSYIMVWMVSLIGYTLGVPDTIMGITFLAAGTSVPDAMASLIVARQGLGDMAVSNSIGSNIFDILLGLALPWFLKTTVIDYGSIIKIRSAGLIYSVILLFATVTLVVGSIHCNGWKLNKRLGIICMVFYAIFLTFSSLIEFNVFGFVNPPICQD